MALTSAWRRKETCGLVAVADAVFAIFTLIIHSYVLLNDSRRKLELMRGFLDIHHHWGLYVLLWVTIYLLNLAQLVIACLLYRSLKPDYPDADLVTKRAVRWLRFSSFLFVVLLSKFVLFMIYFVINRTLDEISLLTCLADMVWRMLTVYIVKRFVDDLRVQYPGKQQPSVYFISAFSKPAIST